jgi:hypothetical protein
MQAKQALQVIQVQLDIRALKGFLDLLLQQEQPDQLVQLGFRVPWDWSDLRDQQGRLAARETKEKKEIPETQEHRVYLDQEVSRE